MKTPARRISLIISWLLALGIGLMIGRENVSRESATAPADDSAAKARQTASSRTAAADDSPLADRKVRKMTSSKYSGSEEERHIQAMTDLSDILNTSNRVERTRQMLSFIDQIGDEEMAGIISGFQEAGWVDFNRSEYSMLISTWMDRDPLTAINFLAENEADGWTRKLAVSAWASENPQAAAEATKNLEDGGKVNDWVVGLIEGIARNDPEGALHAILNLPNGDTKWQAVRETLPEVVIRGSEFASQWLEKIEDPKLQRESAKRLAQSLANRDPEAASEWIEKMTSVETRQEASQVVSEIYAEQDLDAAIAWTETLPQDTLPVAARGVAKHLTREDPASAAQWLLKLGDSPNLDGARIRFLREAGPASPEIALEQVPSLSRADDQERYYGDILKRWKKNNADDAIAWAHANASSIPPKVLKSILPKVKKDKRN